MKGCFLRFLNTINARFAFILLSFLFMASAGAFAATGTFHDFTMEWDGVTRYYEVYLPPVLPPNPPMLLMLHGTSYDVPPKIPYTNNYGWIPVANKYQFILVKPASTYNSQSGQWNWNAYYMDAAFQSPPPDDVGFLRKLILNLTAQYNVDPKRIYVAGMSSGGQMTHRVGVEISDLVAAIVPGSGTVVGQLSPPPISLPGIPAAPVSVQEWHGTLDTNIPPCNNGTTKYSGKKFYLATVDESFNYWVQQNTCTQLQNNKPLCQNGSPNGNTTGNDATSCSDPNVEVQFIWEKNVAHSWVSTNNTARWLFLDSHRKP